MLRTNFLNCILCYAFRSPILQEAFFSGFWNPSSVAL